MSSRIESLAANQLTTTGELNRLEFKSVDAPTMSSIELVQVINDLREEGKAELRHDHFLEKIEKVLGDAHPKFRGTYKDRSGRDSKCYYLPKREASLMVMSESYAVQAKVYDRMTELESGIADPLATLPPEHRALVALMVDNAKIKAQQSEIIAKQETQAESIKRLEAKQSGFEDGVSYFTVIGYGAMHGLKLDNAAAIRIGKRAGQLSKRKGLSVGKVRDVRFGLVNSYHESILDTAFIEAGGIQ